MKAVPVWGSGFGVLRFWGFEVLGGLVLGLGVQGLGLSLLKLPRVQAFPWFHIIVVPRTQKSRQPTLRLP